MNGQRPDRRQFLFGLIAGTAATGAAALGAIRAPRPADAQAGAARLRSRPRSSTGPRLPAGRHALPDAAGRDAFVYVPDAIARASTPAPLLVLLHGASRSFPAMDRIRDEADRRHFVVVVPMAERHTWDLLIDSRYGSDVGRIDAALGSVFEGTPIDPTHLCLAGFSDGASYALSVGLQNGDLFSHLIAFSPGFIGPGAPVGSPRVFVSHGRADRILPIGRTGARVASSLELRDLDYRYREFDGGHEMPDAIRAEALDWFLGTRPTGRSGPDAAA